MSALNLTLLAKPFPASDIEFRVISSGMGRNSVWARVVAFVTARAIQSRLDAVCGPDGWRTEVPEILTIDGKSAFSCGLSIRIDNEWITKYDVSSPTSIEPAKGGWSQAVKRAGCAWSIGRYLYYLDSIKVETSETDPAIRGWHWARLSEKQVGGGQVYYWREPTLPGWALPQDEETEVSAAEVNKLKQAWKSKFAVEVTDRADLATGFSRFVASLCGTFPLADHSCWTVDALAKCHARIESTTVPFAEEE